jgi:hypothetical protein
MPTESYKEHRAVLEAAKRGDDRVAYELHRAQPPSRDGRNPRAARAAPGWTSLENDELAFLSISEAGRIARERARFRRSS